MRFIPQTTRVLLSLVAFLVFALVAGDPAAAEGMKVNPGKWEFRSTSKMPMMSQPRVHRKTQCIEQGEIDPNQFLSDMKEECRVTDIHADAERMSWKLNCSGGGGGSMTGAAEFTSTGKEVHGRMKMRFPHGGQEFTYEITWEGHFIGPCD